MATSTDLSDAALSVFAFAVYHQLASGEPVAAVVREDGAGHQVATGAIEELQRHEMARADDNRIVFSAKGQAMVGRLLDAMRRGQAEPA